MPIFRKLFKQGRAMRWWAYVTRDGRCFVEEFLRERPEDDRNKVLGKIAALDDQGCWSVRALFFKQLILPDKLKKCGININEIKSHQDRVLVIRDGGDAVLLDGIVKKEDWSIRDARELERAVHLGQDYHQRKKEEK